MVLRRSHSFFSSGVGDFTLTSACWRVPNHLNIALTPIHCHTLNGPFASKEEKVNTEYLTEYPIYSYKILFSKYSACEDIPWQLWKTSYRLCWSYTITTWLLLHRDVWESLWSMYSNAIIKIIHRILYKNVYLCKDIKWIFWFLTNFLLILTVTSLHGEQSILKFLFPSLKKKISYLMRKRPNGWALTLRGCMGGTGSLVSQRCCRWVLCLGLGVLFLLVGILEQDNHWPEMSSSGVRSIHLTEQ